MLEILRPSAYANNILARFTLEYDSVLDAARFFRNSKSFSSKISELRFLSNGMADSFRFLPIIPFLAIALQRYFMNPLLGKEVTYNED
jgi:hypothetical protein